MQQYDDGQGVMLVREYCMGGMEGEIFKKEVNFSLLCYH